MTPCLVVLAAGPVTTIQDAGRHGWLRFGVTPAGPMDWRAHMMANRLAGNPPGAAAVEIGPGGICLTVTGAPVRLGVSAPRAIVACNDTVLPDCIALTLHPDEKLAVMPGRASVWGYLAPEGGLDLPPVMGSLATHLRSGIGPLDGKALVTGTRIPVRGASVAGPMVSVALPVDDPVIRFVPGPQDDHFPPEALGLLGTGAFRLAPRSDRMGYRLDGPRLPQLRGHDIVSDGIAMGAIQVPGDGRPIILMADRQPTGGYPKIGTVIRADLPKLAQTVTGQSLTLKAVSVNEAVAALYNAHALIDVALGIARRGTLRPAPPLRPD